jgi:outer membrane protein TolC
VSSTAILFVASIATSTTPDELEFDRPLVERLVSSYTELEPATLGEGPALELDEVLASVEAHHPVLVSATARVRGARGNQLAAAGGFDPKLGAKGQLTPEGFYDVDALDAKLVQPTPVYGLEMFGGYRVGRGNFATYDARETLDGGEIKGGIRLPVLQDGWIDQRRADLRTADLGLEEAEARRNLEALALAVQAGGAYFSWVAAGEAYRVAVRLVRLAERRTAQIDTMVDAGAAPQIYRAENLRSLLKRRAKLVESRRKLEKTAIKLSLFYRGEDGEPERPPFSALPERVPMGERLPEAELSAGLSRALEGRPIVAALRAKLAALEVKSELANNRVLPRLDLELAVSKDLGADPSDKTLEALDPLSIKAGLAMEFPLLLRKGRGKALEADSKVAATAAKLRFTRDKLRTEIQDLWSALRASARRAKVADLAADTAEAVAAGERARLAAGATSPFILNLREQAAADARLEEIEARATLRITLTAWRMLTLVPAP